MSEADREGLRPVMRTSDGAGVALKGIRGSPELLDPFLLLDEFRSDQPGDYSDVGTREPQLRLW